MNKNLLDKLTSPVQNENLIYDQNNNFLISVFSKEKFNLYNGIPILIPSTEVADYSNNVLEILYSEKTKEVEDYIYNNHKDEYFTQLTKQLKNDFDKKTIIEKFIEYSKLPLTKRLEWFIKTDENNSQLTKDTLLNGNTYATSGTGKIRIETAQKMKGSWAVHLDDYSRLVTKDNPDYILELATGAGLGTYGVIESINDSKLITVDIDYTCVCNALGIAKYLNLEDQVFPIVGNFWYLPFTSESMDTICTHYGLDESREITRIIEEISRVLKKDGSFILVIRKDPSIRLRQILEAFDFTHAEYITLAKLGGLFSGQEDLIDTMEKYNLKLNYIKEYSPTNSHERILYKFVKI